MKIKVTNKISTLVLGILALIIFGAMSIKSAPGDLDLTFGNGGIVTTPMGIYSVYPGAILTQPDGKILVCGTTYDDYDYDGESYFLARYHPNGTLDASFGTNGKFVDPFGSGSDCTLQPDGKIVSVGSGALVRYNTDGSLDTSFNGTGKVLTPFGTSVAIQSDGKIVVVGGSSQLGSESFAVVRYNPDGSLDTSFNGTGKVITSFAGDSSAGKALLQPDGKIVAVGDARINNVDTFAFARYNPDGSLDSGFGVGGKVIHPVSNSSYSVRDAVLQPDGKIVASAGIWSNVTTTTSIIVRYNTNGSIDTTFAQSGSFTTEANLNIGDSIALQSDGKLVGFGNTFPNYCLAIARLNPNGTPDTEFGIHGRLITPSCNRPVIGGGAVQSDGKILTVAGAWANPAIEIFRHLGDAIVDRPIQFDFDGDTRSDISVFRPSDSVWYLNQSTAGFSATQFGLATDKIVPADYDGDGKTDIAVYRDGVWYWLNSSNGTVSIVQFGLANDSSIPGLAGGSPIPGLVGDIPIPADYTGDGQAELAVYRGGTWWTLDLSNNQVNVDQFGLVGDELVVGDYDGDGRADQAVYRNGEWHLNQSTQGYAVANFGLASDKPVPADFDGDGRTDPAVYRDGTWYLLRSADGFTAFQFGLATDILVPGDYDGDGRADISVWRPSTGVWYSQRSTSGFTATRFGLLGDRPVQASYVPVQ